MIDLSHRNALAQYLMEQLQAAGVDAFTWADYNGNPAVGTLFRMHAHLLVDRMEVCCGRTGVYCLAAWEYPDPKSIDEVFKLLLRRGSNGTKSGR